MTDPRMTPPTNDAPVTVERLKPQYPDYLDDPDGLARFRQDVRQTPGHDMAKVNHNSLGRLIDTIERLRSERDRLAALASAPAEHGSYSTADVAEAIRIARDQADKVYGIRWMALEEISRFELFAAALARPRAAVGEREAIEALAPYAASVLSIIGAKSRRDNEKHITRADGTGITYGMLRAILALQSPPAKVEG